MDITPYHIVFWNGDTLTDAEVRPCCQEDKVVDYAIYMNEQLAFNITRSSAAERWVISLKNADKEIEEQVIQQIGQEIEKHNSEE